MKIRLFTIILTISLIGCEKDNKFTDTNGVSFTHVYINSNLDYTLDSNIVNYKEIIGYDSTNHIFLVSNEAGERIRSKDYPVTRTPFAIAVDNNIIYIAYFVPGYSSIAYNDCITVEPYSYSNKYYINLGYPSENYSGVDPRNDSRIISRLIKDDKLIEIE